MLRWLVFFLLLVLCVLVLALAPSEGLFTALTAIATTLYAAFAWAQWTTLGTQASHMKAALDASATAADAAKKSADFAREMLATNQRIERAYLDIAHTTDGLTMDDGRGPLRDLYDNRPVENWNVSARIQVRNVGNTPARVTDAVLCGYLGDSLPQPPQYDPNGHVPANAFLVRGKRFSMPLVFPLSGASLAQIKEGTLSQWILAYVDYIDSFGTRHRGGYARRYSPESGDLVFVADREYNYDRERVPGEGNDWPEPAEPPFAQAT